MLRPVLALERLTFLEPEGKVGYRWGRDGAAGFLVLTRSSSANLCGFSWLLTAPCSRPYTSSIV